MNPDLLALTSEVTPEVIPEPAVPAPLTLFFRDGRSDKVYQVRVEPAGGRFVVNFAYGRRGTALNTGTKTAIPVPLDRARDIHDALVRGKLAKGYRPGPDGTPQQSVAPVPAMQAGEGLQPQLLNPVDEAEAAGLLADDGWCLQEKLDGHRRLVGRSGSLVVAANRRGLATGLPETVRQDVLRLPGGFVLDGELVGDRLHVFDLLRLGDVDLRPRPLADRLVELINLLASAQCPHLPLVASAFGAVEKRRRLGELRAARKEGAVFKRLDAPYAPGRPASGGPALKLKFTATLSAVVAAQNERRSVELRLLAPDGDWRTAGNVTVPPGRPVPRPGEVVEVRYLYAFKESGVLFQPVLLGVRADVTAAECSVAQLKYKPEEAEDEG